MAITRVTSEIAGVVVKIEKRPGDAVAADDIVVMLECMKMHIPVTAPVAGRISSIGVTEGETIAEGHVVLTIDARS